MRLDTPDCLARFAAARHAHLATTRPDGSPHLVPVTFALVGHGPGAPGPVEIVTAVDDKPKTTTDLQRLRNLADDPRVTLLADRYDDDWTRLWWVRADGTATVEPARDDDTGRTAALAALAGRYPQYRTDPPRGPVIRVRVERWTGWAYSPGATGDASSGTGASSPRN